MRLDTPDALNGIRNSLSTWIQQGLITSADAQAIAQRIGISYTPTTSTIRVVSTPPLPSDFASSVEYQKALSEYQSFGNNWTPSLYQLSAAGQLKYGTSTAQQTLEDKIASMVQQNLDVLNDPSLFQKIKQAALAQIEPVYQKELAALEEEYNRQAQETALTKEKSLYGLETEAKRTLEDIETKKARSAEDIAAIRQRLARSYDEAMADNRDAMAARRLTFGGTRLKTERKLGEQYQEQLSDAEKAYQRELEDLQKSQQRTTEELAQQKSFLERGYGLTQQAQEAEKAKKARELEWWKTIYPEERTWSALSAAATSPQAVLQYLNR
jgi:hypothetical protein